MRYLDDILILSGAIILGAALYLGVGVTAVIGYVGAILIALGVAFGLRQPRRGEP